LSRYKRQKAPIFRPAPNLVNMTLFVSVSLAICFSVGLILTSTLIYLEIRNHFRAESHVSENDYCWDKIAGIVVSISSIGLGITGLVAITTAPHSTQELYYWLDAVIMCNLQLHTSNNVR
jgi:energy-converting hydrogenase Eha subunit G